MAGQDGREVSAVTDPTPPSFLEWFREQFGSPPKVSVADACILVSDARRALDNATAALEEAERYATWERAARYAWNAAQKETKR